jgi:hypothetical protein
MTDEDDIIADFVVDKKKAPSSKKVVIEDTDYSDPGVQVYWMEVVGGRSRVLGAKIIPVPAQVIKNGSASLMNAPGMERELVMAESMPAFVQFVEAAGKDPADFINYFDPDLKKSGYVFSQKIYEITSQAIGFFLDNMLEKVKKEEESKRAEKVGTKTTSTLS